MTIFSSFFNLRKDFAPKFVSLLIAMSSITGGILLSQPFYFGALALCGLLILVRGRLRMNNVYIFLLLFVCVFSLIVNNPPSYFRAWQRLGVYALVVLVVSPIFVSAYSTQLRAKVLYYFVRISIFLSIGSLFAYFLGINLFVRLGEQLDIGAGTFSGLMNHSMVLGPVAGLSGLFLFATLLANGDKKNKRKNLLRTIAALCCMGACLLSASRSAVGGAGVACIFAIFRIYRRQMNKTIKIIAVIVGIGLATFPIWGGMTNFLVQKQQGNENMGSAIYSRERKFTARILEFKSSPLYGIGYNIVIPEYDGVVKENGQIEPGSSWLAVASMTGVIGLSIFVLICVRGIKRAWRINSPLVGSILGGMLVFFFIHMIAEGYIFAPKSFLSLLFWLVIAVADGIFELEKNRTIDSTIIIK